MTVNDAGYHSGLDRDSISVSDCTRDVVMVGEAVAVRDTWLSLVGFWTHCITSRGAEHVSGPRPHCVWITHLHESQMTFIY